MRPTYTVGIRQRRISLASTTKQTEPEARTLTVEEAARELGISRKLAYQLAGEGRIPAIRLGRRLLIPRVAFDRFLAEAGGELATKRA